MAHPVIEEINRCWNVESIQSHAFRRWQRVLRDEIQTELNKVPVLEAEVEDLKAELVKVGKRPAKKEAAAV